MSNIMDFFKVMIMVQLFYAAGITLLVYGLDEFGNAPLTRTTAFSGITDTINLGNVRDEVQDSLSSQLDMPVVELAALVFYSGNLLVDLLLNFFTAIPQMITILINGILMLFNLNNEIIGVVQLFCTVVISMFYIIGLIEALISLRGRGTLI